MEELDKVELEELGRLNMRERIQRLKQELIDSDYDVDQVAEILDLERSTVLRYLREHVIIGYQTGRKWRVPEDELRAYKERLLAKEREERRIKEIRADIERSYALWSRTQPGARWAKEECPGCGDLVLTSEEDRYDDDRPGNYYVVRVGSCAICGYTVH